MALGTAHLFGYHLTLNFNMPYLAPNISEFWRRWHISLSSWLRDYLFIPLGGSRGSTWMVCRNLLITMTLGGLWHGTSWNFVLWGVIHGLLLIGHRLFQGFCQVRPPLQAVLLSAPGTTGRIAATFLCVSLCWVFFRAQRFGPQAAHFLHRLFVPTSIGLSEPLPAIGFAVVLLLVFLGHLLGQDRLWLKLAAPDPRTGSRHRLCLLPDLHAGDGPQQWQDVYLLPVLTPSRGFIMHTVHPGRHRQAPRSSTDSPLGRRPVRPGSIAAVRGQPHLARPGA